MNEEFNLFISKYSELLPVGSSVSFTEAERRAGEFLAALATITDFRHMFGGEKIKLLSIQTATYATELNKGTAKTVTENKLTAEASEGYQRAREDLEGVENDIMYLKAYYDIFTNAHIFYRKMSSGEVM